MLSATKHINFLSFLGLLLGLGTSLFTSRTVAASELVDGALGSELPWLNVRSPCGEAPDYPGSLKSDFVCGFKTVHELLAWSYGADSLCVGKLADDLVDRFSKGLVERSRNREEVYESLRSIPGTAKDLEDLARYVNLQKTLSNDERVLLFQYFQTGYLRMNPVLRQGGKGVECLEPLTSALTSALRRLTGPYKGIVYRGVKLPSTVLAEYVPGHEIFWPAFSSTSLDRNVAQSFSSSYDNQLPVVFKISSKNCLDVRGISDKLKESEILCPPGTRVRVVRREQPNVIVMDEISE